MTLQELINELADAQREYDQLAFDEEFPHDLGEPCSLPQIARLEAILGAPLPPSYRAFLELHNGWERFDGEARLLAVEDQESEWVKNWVAGRDAFFYESDDQNPFKQGAIPIMVGVDQTNFLVLDPRTVRPDGEMDFVAYDIASEEERFSSFVSFLQDELALWQTLIEKETLGIAEEDDEEDDDE